MEKAPQKIYGLIGYPLTHSFSQSFFTKKFEAEAIDAQYLNFEIDDIGSLMEIVAEHHNLQGLNVTIPYKEQVLPYIDELHPDAAEIGAVNVIKIVHNGDQLKLIGHNSDIIGFCDSIAPLLTPIRRKALVLGSGGAAKAIFHGLKKLGVEPTYVSRTEREGSLTYSRLTPEIMTTHRVIVNTTPLGMYPHTDECPDIPYHLLTTDHLCYDVIYNPASTLFMKRAEGRGAEVKNGLEMLHLQALAAWRIWNE